MSTKASVHEHNKTGSKKLSQSSSYSSSSEIPLATSFQQAKYDPRSLSQHKMIQLQRTIGNRAVNQMIKGMNQHQSIQAKSNDPNIDGIQRQISVLQRTPEQELIDQYTTLNFLDEQELGQNLLRRLPSQSAFVNSVLNTLSDSDRDDISYYISSQATENQLMRIGTDSAGRSLMRRMVRELQSGVTDDEDAIEIERLIRCSSPSHQRLREEEWASESSITSALASSGTTAQSILSGAGDYIYDEYSVIIDRMPPGLTPEQYLSEMANDLNQAVNDELFDIINEFHRTNTSRPPQVGDIYEIDIAGPDNGSVMLVEQTSSYFIFQTVATSSQGTHPEYGSREFGFERNRNESVKFYTRGASRPENQAIGVVGRTPQTIGWTRLMRGISDAINSRGGVSRPSSFRMWTTHRD